MQAHLPFKNTVLKKKNKKNTLFLSHVKRRTCVLELLPFVLKELRFQETSSSVNDHSAISRAAVTTAHTRTPGQESEFLVPSPARALTTSVISVRLRPHAVSSHAEVPLDVRLRPWLVSHGAIVQPLSHVQLFVTPGTAVRQASLFFTPRVYLGVYLPDDELKLISTESIMLSNHLSLPSPPASILPSLRVFSKESIRWPKYWSFSFSISRSNEYWGLISFRIDWLDLLAVSGILNSLLQHHSSKASILRHSAFFMVQLSHP